MKTRTKQALILALKLSNPLFFSLIFLFVQFEQSRKHIPTSVQCYMKQYDVTKCEAYDELNKQVVSAWKDINHESLKPTQVPLPVIVRVLNFTRVEDIVYKEADNYTHAGNLMKDLIALILIDPIPI